MIKVEVGQVWISNTDYTFMHMIVAKKRGGEIEPRYELAGVAKRWSEEYINKHYTLNRYASGLLNEAKIDG